VFDWFELHCISLCSINVIDESALEHVNEGSENNVD
jgi:hypothetical protein